MSAAKHTPGPWEPVSLLRKAGEPKARLVVRRLVWTNGEPKSECMPGTFGTLDEARAAIARATNGSALTIDEANTALAVACSRHERLLACEALIAAAQAEARMLSAAIAKATRSAA